MVYAINFRLAGWKNLDYRLTFGGSAVFLFLAFVPGVMAIVYHLVTVTQRREQNLAMADRLRDSYQLRLIHAILEGDADASQPADETVIAMDVHALIANHDFFYDASTSLLQIKRRAQP